MRDFNAICSWLPNATNCQMEIGGAADQIGAIRRFYLGGSLVRERLLALSDQEHSCSYSLLEGPLSVRNLVGSFRLYPVTDPDGTFGQWGAKFDANEQKDEANIIEQLRKLYGGGWTNLKTILRSEPVQY
jgi:hypothetical protein